MHRGMIESVSKRSTAGKAGKNGVECAMTGKKGEFLGVVLWVFVERMKSYQSLSFSDCFFPSIILNVFNVIISIIPRDGSKSFRQDFLDSFLV